MLTSPVDVLVRDGRPAYRPFRLEVARVTPLSPAFTRVTLTGADVALFGRAGLDQRVKLLFPLPGGRFADFGIDDPEAHLAGDWYARWLAVPDAERNPMRTFTARAVRADARELDIDFAVHSGGHGPAGHWLASAAPGGELVVVGPDVRSEQAGSGIDWRPGTANRVLLAADETALPAVCGILDSLGPNVTAHVFVETGSAADAVPVRSRARGELHWLARDAAARGERLTAALRGWLASHAEVVRAAASPVPQELADVDVDHDLLWDSPDEHAAGGFYAWLAGEAAVIKGLRRMLVTDSGIDRKRVAFMGYWRHGREEQTS